MGVYMNKLIYSEEKIIEFLNLLPELENDEVLFIDLFQRNKHISPEDRKTLGLTRCNVIDRVVCTSKDKVIKHLKRWEANPEGFLTNTNLPIPNEALVPYITIQPISVLKAYQEFNRCMTEYLIELGSHTGKVNKENTYHRIKKANNLLLDCHQHAYSRKVFIDVDYDGDKNAEWLPSFEQELTDKNVKFMKVETQGGYHYLLRKDSLKFNYNLIIDKYKPLADRELEISNNQAIPISGCYQYGNFEVTIARVEE